MIRTVVARGLFRWRRAPGRGGWPGGLPAIAPNRAAVAAISTEATPSKSVLDMNLNLWGTRESRASGTPPGARHTPAAARARAGGGSGNAVAVAARTAAGPNPRRPRAARRRARPRSSRFLAPSLDRPRARPTSSWVWPAR